MKACPGSTSADGGASCGSGGCLECSGHGSCDQETGTCARAAPWSGEGCEVHGCGPSGCGAHGECVAVGGTMGGRYACACEPGWTGEDCSLRACDESCGDAGWCYNGTCTCYPGSEVEGGCSRGRLAKAQP